MSEVSDDRLRLLIERAERLIDERKGINDDLKDVFGEGKSAGYDPKIMKLIIRLRAMRPEERQEMDLLTDTYRAAIGLS